LVNYEHLYSKMSSSDYRKNMEASQKLIKACQDITLANSIRELTDLLLKWVTIKLYGGNVPMVGLIELVCTVLVVAEKKKIAWTDFDIDTLLYLTKEYLLTCFYGCGANMDTLRTMFKLAVALSSGERIIRKILLEMRSDIMGTHRQAGSVRREGLTCTTYCRRCWCQICGFLVDYFSNDSLLQEASRIP
jgi:hypothetical protein